MAKFYLVENRVVYQDNLLFTDGFEEVFPCDYFEEMQHADLVELWNAFCETDGGFAHRTIYPNNETSINKVFPSAYDFACKITEQDCPYLWDKDWFMLDDWNYLVSFDEPIEAMEVSYLEEWVYEFPNLFLKLVNKED